MKKILYFDNNYFVVSLIFYIHFDFIYNKNFFVYVYYFNTAKKYSK